MKNKKHTQEAAPELDEQSTDQIVATIVAQINEKNKQIELLMPSFEKAKQTFVAVQDEYQKLERQRLGLEKLIADISGKKNEQELKGVRSGNFKWTWYAAQVLNQRGPLSADELWHDLYSIYKDYLKGRGLPQLSRDKGMKTRHNIFRNLDRAVESPNKSRGGFKLGIDAEGRYYIKE